LPDPQIEQRYLNNFEDKIEEQGRSYGAYLRWMILPKEWEHSYDMTEDIPGKQVLEIYNFLSEILKSAHSVNSNCCNLLPAQFHAKRNNT
jgi:hypothetical protein